MSLGVKPEKNPKMPSVFQISFTDDQIELGIMRFSHFTRSIEYQVTHLYVVSLPMNWAIIRTEMT